MQLSIGSASNRLLAPILIACALLAGAVGCSTPMEPGVVIDEARDPELSPLEMKVVISSTDGVRLRGVNVTAHTGTFEITMPTDFGGTARVVMPYRAHASVDFKFSSSEIDWSETVFEIPVGVTMVTIYFIADNLGKVRFSHLQY